MKEATIKTRKASKKNNFIIKIYEIINELLTVKNYYTLTVSYFIP